MILTLLIVIHNLEVNQMGVKTPFLNVDLEKEIYLIFLLFMDKKIKSISKTSF